MPVPLIIPGVSPSHAGQAVLLGGNGRRMYRFRDIEFFAKTGAVFLFDNNTGKGEKMDPDVVIERAEALGAAARKIADKYPDVRRELEKAANELKECANHAKHQGSFWDPRVQEYHERHCPKTMVFNGTDVPQPAEG